MSESVHLVNDMQSLSIEEKFVCDICGAGYKKKGNFAVHMESKHESSDRTKSGGECQVCGAVLASRDSLIKHMKNHRKCNICTIEFDTAEECVQHKKEHTTCKTCLKDCVFPSRLKTHKCKR